MYFTKQQGSILNGEQLADILFQFVGWTAEETCFTRKIKLSFGCPTPKQGLDLEELGDTIWNGVLFYPFACMLQPKLLKQDAHIL